MLRGCGAGDPEQAAGGLAAASLASGESDEEVVGGEEGGLPESGPDGAGLCGERGSTEKEPANATGHRQLSAAILTG